MQSFKIVPGIESLLTRIIAHQHYNALEDHVRSSSDDVQDVRDQLFKLLRGDLVKDPTDPSEGEGNKKGNQEFARGNPNYFLLVSQADF